MRIQGTLVAVIAAAVLGKSCSDPPFSAYVYRGNSPSAAAEIAAEEVAHYVGEITGTQVSVVVEGTSSTGRGFCILVGDSDRAGRLGFDSSRLEAEEIRLQTGPGWLVVIGGDEGPGGQQVFGTLWAAYELLDELGVRWLWPGPLGEVVPKKPGLRIPEMDVTRTPPIVQRRIRNMSFNRRIKRGLEKLGFTREQYEAVHKDGNAWFRRQRLGQRGRYNYTHAFGDWYETYHDAHRSWFALQPDGTRNQPGIEDRARLCVSNPEVVAEAAEKACAKLAANPDLMCASVSPNDGGKATFCLCENCRALDPPNAEWVKVWHPTDPDFMMRSLSDRYAHFYSAVAEIVTQRFPDRYVGAYAYSAYRLPPVREDLHPRVFLGFVGLRYLNEESRGTDLRSWDGWSEVASQLFLRPNFLSETMGFPVVCAHRMTQDLGHCFETGMKVTDFDGCHQHWALRGLDYYVLARFLWDPEMDVDEVIEDYCRAGWGAAAGPIQEYFGQIEGVIDEVAAEGEYQSWKKSTPVLAAHYTDMTLARCQGLLNRAKLLARRDPDTLDRIAFLEIGLQHTRLSRDQVLAREAFQNGTGSKLAWTIATAALDDFYRRIGITWAVNSPLLKFFGY